MSFSFLEGGNRKFKISKNGGELVINNSRKLRISGIIFVNDWKIIRGNY